MGAKNNDSRPCLGASAILKSVDFRAFAVNVKTIVPTQKLYQFGHAIWNADLPMPLYTFLEEYDFRGKTIIPFTTHGGSGFSRTIQTISDLQPNAAVISDGLSISRNSVSGAESDVVNWVNGLNLNAE